MKTQIPHHWTHDIIGKPYAFGAIGPDKFDCWGVVHWKFKTVDNIELPGFAEIATDNVNKFISSRIRGMHHDILSHWVDLEHPEDGCVVFMGKRPEKMYTHVGIWVSADGGYVIHAIANAHVMAMSPHTLKRHGWKHFRYYKHKDQK